MKMLTDLPLCNMLPRLPCLVLHGVLVAQPAYEAAQKPQRTDGPGEMLCVVDILAPDCIG